MRRARGMTGLVAMGLLVLWMLRHAATGPTPPRAAGDAASGGAFASLEACRRTLATRDRSAEAPPRIGSWNIRWFPDGAAKGPHPERATDVEWLACAIASLGVQVLAVQEMVQHPRGRRALLDLLDRLDALTDGRWAHALDDCAGSGRQHVGLLFDQSRVSVEQPRMVPRLNPGKSACDRSLRPGFAAYVRFAHGPDLHLITLHLDSGTTPRDFASRKSSLSRLPAVVRDLSGRAPDADVVVLGDFNTMGCGRCEPAVDSAGEVQALEAAAARAGLLRLDVQPSCTHYYRGRPGQLDHVLVSRALHELATPAPLSTAGACAQRSCRRLARGEAPASLTRLSDHCPLVLQLTPEDAD